MSTYIQRFRELGIYELSCLFGIIKLVEVRACQDTIAFSLIELVSEPQQEDAVVILERKLEEFEDEIVRLGLVIFLHFTARKILQFPWLDLRNIVSLETAYSCQNQKIYYMPNDKTRARFLLCQSL